MSDVTILLLSFLGGLLLVGLCVGISIGITKATELHYY